TVVGLRRCGWTTVREVGYEPAPGFEAGGAGAAERDSHGYTGAAFRPCDLGADRYRVRNGAGMDRGSRGRCRGSEKERAEHNCEHDGTYHTENSGHIGTGGCLGAVSGSRFVDQRILTVALDESRFQFRERNDDVSPIA